MIPGLNLNLEFLYYIEILDLIGNICYLSSLVPIFVVFETLDFLKNQSKIYMAGIVVEESLCQYRIEEKGSKTELILNCKTCTKSSNTKKEYCLNNMWNW